MAIYLLKRLKLKWQFRGKLRRTTLEYYEKKYGRCGDCNAVIIPIDRKRTVEVSVGGSGGNLVQHASVRDAACPLCGRVYIEDVFGEAESTCEQMRSHFGV